MRKTVHLRLNAFEKKMSASSDAFLGFPCNGRYDYSALFPFFNYFLNNIGDPFVESLYPLNSREFEQEVLHFFAKLYKMPKHDFWGYVTHGGTEGNMFGLFSGRELYPDGIFYYSQESHYSISKITRVLGVTSEVIPSLKNGEIDYLALEARILKNKNKPVILNLNIGTTMKGAIDNIDTVVDILKKNNIHDYYIHCDAALSGMILPFIPEANCLNFDQKPIASIAVSGHKFIGSTIPCGIVLVRKEYVKNIKHSIEYIGTDDATIAGSRNAHTVLMLWYIIAQKGLKGFRADVNQCLKNAQYLYNKLQEINYPCLLNKFSTTVVLKKPPLRLLKKWHLAPMDDFAHIVVMRHVSRKKIDAFLSDLKLSLPK